MKLQDPGKSARQAAAPSALNLPSDRFHCRLDDQPGLLVPNGTLQVCPEDAQSEGLMVAEHCWLSARRWRYPEPMTGISLLLENFYLEGDIVWVTTPVLRTVVPFLLGPVFSKLLDGLRPGIPARADLDRDVLQVLWSSGILRTRKAQILEKERLARTIASCADSFRLGFVPIPALLNAFQLGALRRYFRYRIRNDEFRLGDQQSSLRYVAHNEGVARFWHYQLAHVVSTIAGRSLKPSYAFLASYQSGASLPIHTDREQCEFSLTLLVDYSPEPEAQSPWPLHLVTSGGRVTIYQALGDALLYRGRTIPHYREEIPKGHTSTSIFFHYVSQDFRGTLQ